MFRIVKRECNRLKRGRRWLTGDAITEDILPVVTPEPVEWRHDVAAALESLPAHYREVVLLRDLEGLTIAEIADHLALTREAVKSRLHRARRWRANTSIRESLRPTDDLSLHRIRIATRSRPAVTPADSPPPPTRSNRMSKQTNKPIALALGAALVGGLALSGSAFAMSDLASGYMLGAGQAAAAEKPRPPKASAACDKMDTDKDGKVSQGRVRRRPQGRHQQVRRARHQQGRLHQRRRSSRRTG